MAETKKKNNGSLPEGTILRNGQYQYRIGEVLGQGNYGITYKASAMVKIGNISKPMTFAVKENFAKDYCSRKADGVTLRYAEEHAEEAERDLREFIAEGKTLERICHGHENIVNVNETFEENNTAYYVMEFIEGGNLCDLVKSKGRLTENEAIQILVPIVDAVSHMHKNRRLHLDIKPENIMLKKDGTPILIDFGITLHFNANGGLTGTSKDRSGGLSEGYAPMEQYLGVTTFAPEIDVYALGATLYYMLIGKDPVKASDISSKKIEAALPLDISETVRSALLHAMKKLTEDRTQSADEFLIELRKLGVKPERVKPKNNSVLPIGYVVEPGSEKYSIIELISRSENVIIYKAIGIDAQHRNNVYILYELFLEGEYSRNSDMSVNNPNSESVCKYFFSHDGEYGNAPTSLINVRYEEIKNYMPGIIAPGSDIDSDGKNSKFWFNNTLYVAKWLEEIIVPDESLSFGGKLKDAHNKRSWKASLLLYLGFLGSLYLFYEGVIDIYLISWQGYYYWSDYLMSILSSMYLIPAFLFVDLLVGNKGAFLPLTGMGIVITLTLITYEKTYFIPLSFLVGVSFYLIVLWYSLHEKTNGKPYWNMMDSRIGPIIVSIIVSAFICGCTIYIGCRTGNQQMNEENANLDHDSYSQVIKNGSTGFSVS